MSISKLQYNIALNVIQNLYSMKFWEINNIHEDHVLQNLIENQKSSINKDVFKKILLKYVYGSFAISMAIDENLKQQGIEKILFRDYRVMMQRAIIINWRKLSHREILAKCNFLFLSFPLFLFISRPSFPGGLTIVLEN